MRKIIDAHCHIYPPKIAERALEGIRGFYKLDAPEQTGRNDGTLETLIELGQEQGVTHFLCHSVATVPEQVQSINNFISQSQEAHPDVVIGFGTLHPESPDIKADLDYLIANGLKGVKLHPDFQGFALDSGRAYEMGEMIRDAGLPVLIHCGDPRYDRSNPPQLKKFLDELPDLTVIGAHLGGWKAWDEAVNEFAGRPSFYVDCSSSMYWLDNDSARSIIRRYGADRVMFGTDYPVWRIDHEIARVEALGLTPEEEDMIFYGTAAKLLGVADDHA